MSLEDINKLQTMATACAATPGNYRRFVLDLTSAPETYNLSDEVLSGLVEALHRLTPASLELDHFKRAMTYGEKLRINPPAAYHGINPVIRAAATANAEGYELSARARMHLLLIHALLGKITEAMELVPLLIQAITDDTFDRLNLIEELGDDAFYTALAEVAASIQPGQAIQRNVLKLGNRYKGGTFTREEAVNRNLDLERAALGEGEKALDQIK